MFALQFDNYIMILVELPQVDVCSSQSFSFYFPLHIVEELYVVHIILTSIGFGFGEEL